MSEAGLFHAKLSEAWSKLQPQNRRCTSGGGEKALGGNVNSVSARACICTVTDSSP